MLSSILSVIYTRDNLEKDYELSDPPLVADGRMLLYSMVIVMQEISKIFCLFYHKIIDHFCSDTEVHRILNMNADRLNTKMIFNNDHKKLLLL